MDVSIITVSYNTRELLGRCLSSIYRETAGVSFEMFVVDNDSKDGSADMVEQRFPQVNLIRSDRNLGFAGGNNLALEKASGRYFLLLNPDTELVNNAVRELTMYMDGNPDVGGAGSMLLDDREQVQTVCRKFSRVSHELGELAPLLNRFSWSWTSRDYLPSEFDYNAAGETDYVQGACLMVRRDVAEKVGFLDERYFMYSEEEDWCLQIKQDGWKVMYVPSAVIVHYRGMSTMQRSTDMLAELYKSKVKYFRKNCGWLRYEVFRLTILGIMAFRLPLYSGLSLLLGGTREDIRESRDRSLAILKAMF